MGIGKVEDANGGKGEENLVGSSYTLTNMLILYRIKQYSDRNVVLITIL